MYVPQKRCTQQLPNKKYVSVWKPSPVWRNFEAPYCPVMSTVLWGRSKACIVLSLKSIKLHSTNPWLGWRKHTTWSSKPTKQYTRTTPCVYYEWSPCPGQEEEMLLYVILPRWVAKSVWWRGLPTCISNISQRHINNSYHCFYTSMSKSLCL